MSSKRRALGRDLEDLLGHLKNNKAEQPEFEPNFEGQLKHLSLSEIQAGKYQPRTNFSEEQLNELAESIRAQGVIQPIIVRSLEKDRYEIIAGERRFRAASIAGLTHIPALVREMPDEAVIAIALIENIQRENLNPIESAVGIERLIKEFKMTHEQVANVLSKSRSHVSNLLRLLQLPESIKQYITDGRIEMGHARALLALNNELQQKRACEIIEKRGFSVRQAESLVQLLLHGKKSAPLAAANDMLLKRQLFLKQKLHNKLSLRPAKNGKIQLKMLFTDEQALQKFIDIIDSHL